MVGYTVFSGLLIALYGPLFGPDSAVQQSLDVSLVAIRLAVHQPADAFHSPIIVLLLCQIKQTPKARLTLGVLLLLVRNLSFNRSTLHRGGGFAAGLAFGRSFAPAPRSDSFGRAGLAASLRFGLILIWTRLALFNAALLLSVSVGLFAIRTLARNACGPGRFSFFPLGFVLLASFGFGSFPSRLSLGVRLRALARGSCRTSPGFGLLRLCFRLLLILFRGLLF